MPLRRLTDPLLVLTPVELKRQAFVVEYLKSPGDIARAAQAVGWCVGNRRTAHAQGSRLLRHPQVVAAIQDALASQVKPAEVVAELKRVGMANVADFVTIDEDGLPRIDLRSATREQMAGLSAVQSEVGAAGVIKAKITLGDKMGALNTLAKHLQLLGTDTQINVFAHWEELVRESMAPIEGEARVIEPADGA